MNNDETVEQLDEIIESEYKTRKGYNITNELEKLRDELKHKPKYINGEIVYFDGIIQHYNRYSMSVDNCERLEKLPTHFIHFIPWSGGDRPCIGLVVVKLRGSSNNTYPLYKVQRSECLAWNHGKIEEAIDIIGYQPIKDLKEE